MIVKMDITCNRIYEQFKIYINGQLHLQLKTTDLVGFQSWIHGEKEYYIEYYFTTRKITTAYGDKNRWSGVLELLDKHLTIIG